LTQGGKEADADVFGLAHGVLEMTTVFGAPDTPLTHLARPVYWFGYGPILSGKPRRASIIARSEVWLAQVSQRAIRELLAAHPQWWREFATIALEYGDLAANVAADLLIRNSERRCAAVLLRLGGCRFEDPADGEPRSTPLTQDELAAMANLSRNSAGTILRGLAGRGLIDLQYGSVSVRAPAALRVLVDGS